MANYATNIFHASTENKQDLNKIEAFLDDNLIKIINESKLNYYLNCILVESKNI